jgi:hypothetical protein
MMYNVDSNYASFRDTTRLRGSHARIDSSGNVLVGKTSPAGVSTNGVELRNDGIVIASKSSGVSGYFGRTSTDGEIVRFYRDSTTVGSIGSYSSGLDITGSSRGIRFSGSTIFPVTNVGGVSDNSVQLGYSGGRFTDLYLSGAGYFGKTSGAAFNTTVGVAVDGAAGYINPCRASGPTAYFNRTTTVGENVLFLYNGATVGTISVSASSTSYNTSSDYRLKTDVQPMTGASARVQALKPVNFEWIADGTRVDGFLAHEAQEVVPEAVTGAKDAMRDEEYEVTPAVLDDDGNVVTEAVMGTRTVPDYQGIDQSKLVPLLTAALQEALQKIEALEARITALEA